MDAVPALFFIAAGVVTLSGVLPLVYAAFRLLGVARLTGDTRFALEAISLIIFAVGLALEALGLISSVLQLGGHRPPWARHAIPGVEVGMVLQASLLAGYLYVASYAVHAGALYSGRFEPLLPAILVVYAEYNIIALVFLAVLCYALVEVYRAGRQAVIYHGVLCASHMLGILAAGIGGAALAAPPVLRGAAAWLLLLPTGRRG